VQPSAATPLLERLRVIADKENNDMSENRKRKRLLSLLVGVSAGIAVVLALLVSVSPDVAQVGASAISPHPA
jgi:hypothetical protein